MIFEYINKIPRTSRQSPLTDRYNPNQIGMVIIEIIAWYRSYLIQHISCSICKWTIGVIRLFNDLWFHRFSSFWTLKIIFLSHYPYGGQYYVHLSPTFKNVHILIINSKLELCPIHLKCMNTLVISFDFFFAPLIWKRIVQSKWIYSKNFPLNCNWYKKYIVVTKILNTLSKHCNSIVLLTSLMKCTNLCIVNVIASLVIDALNCRI